MEFQFPDVRKGDLVLFMTSPSEEANHPFVVSDVGDGTISGSVLWPNGTWSTRDGVRHISDPWLQDERKVAIMVEDDEMGVFVEHPRNVEMRERVDDAEAAAEASVEACESLAETVANLIQMVAKVDPEASKLAVSAPKKRGRPPKKKEESLIDDAKPSKPVSLSSIIGGPTGKVDPTQKAAALAAGR